MDLLVWRGGPILFAVPILLLLPRRLAAAVVLRRTELAEAAVDLLGLFVPAITFPVLRPLLRPRELPGVSVPTDAAGDGAGWACCKNRLFFPPEPSRFLLLMLGFSLLS